jgi:hypothetical protein
MGPRSGAGKHQDWCRADAPPVTRPAKESRIVNRHRPATRAGVATEPQLPPTGCHPYGQSVGRGRVRAAAVDPGPRCPYRFCRATRAFKQIALADPSQYGQYFVFATSTSFRHSCRWSSMRSSWESWMQTAQRRSAPAEVRAASQAIRSGSGAARAQYAQRVSKECSPIVPPKPKASAPATGGDRGQR